MAGVAVCIPGIVGLTNLPNVEFGWSNVGGPRNLRVKRSIQLVNSSMCKFVNAGSTTLLSAIVQLKRRFEEESVNLHVNWIVDAHADDAPDLLRHRK